MQLTGHGRLGSSCLLPITPQKFLQRILSALHITLKFCCHACAGFSLPVKVHMYVRHKSAIMERDITCAAELSEGQLNAALLLPPGLSGSPDDAFTSELLSAVRFLTSCHSMLPARDQSQSCHAQGHLVD